MFKKLLIATVAGALLAAPVALAQTKAPEPCHDGCQVKEIEERVWIPAQFRTVSVREFIPARYRTVETNEWVPPRYTTVRTRVWIPPRYTRRLVRVWIPAQFRSYRVPVQNHCGHIVGYRRIQRQIPGTGKHVLQTKEVKEPGTGEYVIRTSRKLVPGTGLYVTRKTRQIVPGTGVWVTRKDRERIPGTGIFRTVSRFEVAHVEPTDDGPEIVPEPRPMPLPEKPLMATGSGAVPAREGLSRAQARLLALRAARLDALRKLAEQLAGIKLDSRTTVQDFVTRSDEIAAKVDAFIKGARETGLRFNEDGTADVRMQIDAKALQTFLASDTFER